MPQYKMREELRNYFESSRIEESWMETQYEAYIQALTRINSRNRRRRMSTPSSS
jgi:hypothetical protein